jgi:hypothetical protein
LPAEAAEVTLTKAAEKAVLAAVQTAKTRVLLQIEAKVVHKQQVVSMKAELLETMLAEQTL